MTKNFSLVLLAFAASIALTSALINSEYVKFSQPDFISSGVGFVSQPHPFGATHHKRHTPLGSESIVHLPENGLFSEHEHLAQLHDEQLFKLNNAEEMSEAKNDALLNCEDDGESQVFKVFPKFITTLTPETSTFQYSAICFQDNQVSLDIVDSKTVKVTIVAKSPKNLLCTDSYFFSTLMNFHIEAIATSGTHTITLKVSPTELAQIQTAGIHFFRVCDKTTNFLPDLLKTIWLFLGGLGLNPHIPFIGSKPTKFQTEQNIKFIYEGTGYQWQERPKAAQKTVVELDESLFNSGDFLAITRFDGLDQIIEYGTGSHVGHCTMILKLDGEAYVVESQSAWYWPRKDIQINPYKQWIKWANDAGFHVTWLPLKKEYAEKYNTTAAYEWFKTIEGTPYGYHNFIFGWIDTPDHSFPPTLDPQFVGPAFAIVEKLIPSAAQSVFTLALNKRLGTENLTVAQIAMEAANRGLTLPDLYAIPEQDGWMYPDGLSYVCSSFVVAMYKAGGLFGDIEVHGVEFTPKDLYELEFIDPTPQVPENCKSLDPQNPYCQIMGDYRMEFPTISTLSPYPHMNEHCWSEGPLYQRYPAGC
jgi:hypothetical protein